MEESTSMYTKEIVTKLIETSDPAQQEILSALEYIHKLRYEVNQRIERGLMPVKDLNGNILNEDIMRLQIRALAAQIAMTGIQNPVIITLLDGGIRFSTALQEELHKIKYQFESTTIQASSYGDGTSSGELKVSALPKIPLGARHVILVDDVLDTGKTITEVADLIRKLQGQDKDQNRFALKCAVLIDKAQPRKIGSIAADFVGFEIDKNAFIVGWGLDYNRAFRNGSDISAVNLETLPNDDEKALLTLEKPLNKKLEEIINQSQQNKMHSTRISGISAGTFFVAQNSDEEYMYPGLRSNSPTPPSSSTQPTLAELVPS